mgnify:CR=1 FL=1
MNRSDKMNNRFFAHEKTLQNIASKVVSLIELLKTDDWYKVKDKLILENANSETWQYSAINKCLFMVTKEGISFCNYDPYYEDLSVMKILVTFHDFKMENITPLDIKDFTDAISTFILQQLKVRYLNSKLNSEAETSIDDISAECIKKQFCTGYDRDVPQDEPWKAVDIPIYNDFYCCLVTFHATIVKKETNSGLRKW